jgi:hypothetical protein
MKCCVALAVGVTETRAVLAEEYGTATVKNSSVFSGTDFQRRSRENARFDENVE